MAVVSGILDNVNVGTSLSNVTNIINQYVVAPIAQFGLAGFVFNAEGEARGTLSSDITDHYAEDNTSLQDQIAIRPKRITLRGYVGEVIFAPSVSAPSPTNQLAEKLVSLSSFLPALSSAAQQLQQDLANPATLNFPSLLGQSANIYALVKNILQTTTGDTPNQENAYNYFKALWQSKTLMSIQTPWEFMTSMAIETVIPMQPEHSKWITEFSVTFKEIRIAQTQTVAYSNTSAAASGNGGNIPAQLTAPASYQQSPLTNQGNITGSPTNISIVPGFQ